MGLAFQVTQQPGSDWALVGAFTAIFGLAGSLFIQRRRVWVRATTGADGVTVVEMAGLGRSESAKLPEELGDLAALVHEQAPTKSDEDEAEAADAATAAAVDATDEDEPHPDAEPPVPAEGPEK